MKYAMVLFSLAFMVALSCTRHSPPSENEVKNQGSNEAKKNVIYVCPMHPEITSTNPKDRCSICGMNLVEKTLDSEGDDSSEKSDQDHQGHEHSDHQDKSGAVPPHPRQSQFVVGQKTTNRNSSRSGSKA